MNPLKFAILLTTVLFFACEKDLNSLINRLEVDSLLAIEWFENNCMKLNQEKCHLLVSGNKFENVWAKIGRAKIWESPKQKLLGVVIDRNLNFNDYVSSLCRKAGKKLSALARLSHFVSLKQEDFDEILYRSTIWLLSTGLDVS